jgi:glycosyltransferase involved in cell wall biosynthesis
MSTAHPNPTPLYASFDRVPAPKGASEHIEAFAGALARALGGLDLVTLGDETPRGAQEAPAEPGDPRALRRIRVGVTGDFLERVASFRAELLRIWGARRPFAHVRSIFEGYPVARDRDRLVERLVFEVNALPSVELKYHHADIAEDRELVRKLRAQETLCLRAADLVVVPSDVTAAFVASRGADAARVRVIRNGVDLERYVWPPPRREPSPGLRILYVGTFSPWQGAFDAIDALGLLGADSQARLTLVGPCRGRQRAEIAEAAHRAGVSSRVVLAPPVPSSALPELYALHDVALAPLTATERNLDQGCCPLKILEAMAAGIPLVASDLAVVRELCGPDEALLVKPSRPRALAEALVAIAADPDAATQRAVRARRRVERAGGWRASCEQLLASYAELGGIS